MPFFGNHSGYMLCQNPASQGPSQLQLPAPLRPVSTQHTIRVLSSTNSEIGECPIFLKAPQAASGCTTSIQAIRNYTGKAHPLLVLISCQSTWCPFAAIRANVLSAGYSTHVRVMERHGAGEIGVCGYCIARLVQRHGFLHLSLSTLLLLLSSFCCSPT